MLVVRPCPMYLYLTTAGRVTGQPREIEIWFTEHGGHFYLVAERKSANWVRNIQSQPQVKVDLPGICGERFRFYAARPSN
jgi:hypothetical protein